MSKKTLSQSIAFPLPEEYILFATVLVAPVILDRSQLVLGSIINFVLAYSAFTFSDWKKIIPALFIPSLVTLLRSFVFGPFTPLIFYLLPFIWTGNAMFVFILRKGIGISDVKLSGIVISSLFKSLFLFSAAYVWVALGVLPVSFKSAMGLIQFITALVGGSAAFLLYSVRKGGYTGRV